ncbi:MAG: hypothetical protein JWP89_5621 [Schlesneria sp.]|nr:hypothetical protein [Schlesneria sp.]
MKLMLKKNPMKQLCGFLFLFCLCAVVGCGSSKVVVDEDAIRAQIAKVEVEEQANRTKEPAQTRQQTVRQSDADPDADPGAEGSN